MTNKIYGTSGDDSLTGTSGSDEFVTYEGKDTVQAGDGDDYINSNETTLWANSGQLIAYGGSGNDKINATDDGNDRLYGEDGDDTIFGRGGNDTLDGGAGDDDLYGGDGNDSLDGGDGADDLYGEDGDDTLDGGAGVDYLSGGDGDDSLTGGSENDTLFGRGGNDVLYGGDGNDSLIGEGNEEDSQGADLIYGEDGDDRLYGWGGNDILDGGVGDDELSGGDGDDTLDGGAGDDDLYGGDGDDTFFYSLGNDSIIGNDGSDTFIASEQIDFFDQLVIEGRNVRLIKDANETKIYNVENFVFQDKAYNIFELVDHVFESSYVKNYYSNSVIEKQTTLNELSEANFQADNYIASLFATRKLKISFPDNQTRESGSYVVGEYLFSPITTEERDLIETALQYLSNYLAFNYELTEDWQTADIIVEKHNMTSAGYASKIWADGDTYLAISSNVNSLDSILAIFIHEFGHTLDLPHTNNYILNFEDGVLVGFGEPLEYIVPTYLDKKEFSQMSYKGNAEGFSYTGDKGFSFAPLDIAYLQKYGLKPAADSEYIVKIGDQISLSLNENVTTVTIPKTTNPFLIIDSGGSDTLNFNSIEISEELVIDLYRGFAGFDRVVYQEKEIILNPILEIYPFSHIENFVGHSGKDYFILGDGDYDILSLSGDDTFRLYGDAKGKITGGEGHDKIYLFRQKDNYQTQSEGDSYIISFDSSQLSLQEIERVEFVDKKIALDIDGNAGAVAKLLGAFLGAEGVQFTEYVTIGLEALDSGTSFEGLLQLALDTVFGSDTSGTELVSTFYKNLTGQTAPQGVINTYATLIDSGSLTPLELATQVAEHPLNAESIDLIGLATTGIEYA